MAIQIDPPKVLLFGAGSIGAVYLYQLQQAGCKVTAVCRSNYTHVKQHGFRLSSVRYGNVNYRPCRTVRDISDCADEVFDYVLVCTKSFPMSKPSLPDMLATAIGSKHTAIVLAQNGIDIEQEVAQAFPENPLLSGVVYLPAIQTGPGTIEYPEMLNLLELGTYPADAPGRHKAAAARFAKLMIKGGGGAEVHDDIQIARWSKLLFNAAWNPICALTYCSDGDFLLTSPFADELAWDVMVEVVALAAKVGIPGITVEVAKSKIAINRKRAEQGTGREMSMLQDIRQGRSFEVEAIIGNAIRLGQRHNLKMPRLETLYALLKGRYDAQLRERERASAPNGSGS
jgi:2-dehydropantoate 2-reductase